MMEKITNLEIGPVLNFIPPKLKSIVQKLYFLYFIKKSHCSNLNLCYNNYKRNKGDKE